MKPTTLSLTLTLLLAPLIIASNTSGHHDTRHQRMERRFVGYGRTSRRVHGGAGFEYVRREAEGLERRQEDVQGGSEFDGVGLAGMSPVLSFPDERVVLMISGGPALIESIVAGETQALPTGVLDLPTMLEISMTATATPTPTVEEVLQTQTITITDTQRKSPFHPSHQLQPLSPTNL